MPYYGADCNTFVRAFPSACPIGVSSGAGSDSYPTPVSDFYTVGGNDSYPKVGKKFYPAEVNF